MSISISSKSHYTILSILRNINIINFLVTVVQLYLYHNVIILLFNTHSQLECLWIQPVKVLQTKTQSLIGGERYLSAALSDASQFLLFPQPVNDDTLEVAPRVQFILPVIKDRQRSHNEEHLKKIITNTRTRMDCRINIT